MPKHTPERRGEACQVQTPSGGGLPGALGGETVESGREGAKGTGHAGPCHPLQRPAFLLSERKAFGGFGPERADTLNREL